MLRVLFPAALVRPPTDLLTDYMTVVRRAKSREEILANSVPAKGLRAGKGRPGFAGFEPLSFAATVDRTPPGPQVAAQERATWQPEFQHQAHSLFYFFLVNISNSIIHDFVGSAQQSDEQMRFILSLLRCYFSFARERAGPAAREYL